MIDIDVRFKQLHDPEFLFSWGVFLYNRYNDVIYICGVPYHENERFIWSRMLNKIK